MYIIPVNTRIFRPIGDRLKSHHANPLTLACGEGGCARAVLVEVKRPIENITTTNCPNLFGAVRYFPETRKGVIILVSGTSVDPVFDFCLLRYSTLCHIPLLLANPLKLSGV